MVNFLRQVKAEYPNELWQELRRQYPDLLKNTPTVGRSIGWHEIDRTRPPLFGSTLVEQLKWVNVGVHRIVEEEELRRVQPPEQAPTMLRNGAVEPNEEAREVPLSYPRLCVGLWCIGLVTMIVLLSFRAESDSQAVKTAGNILIAALAGTGFPVVAMRCVEYIADNPSQENEGVVCLGGRNNELPYVSARGRWGRLRVLYWYCYSCGIALGSIFLVYRHIPLLLFFGSFLLSSIVLLYRCISFLADIVQTEEGTPLSCFLKFAMARICVFATICSLGIGLLTTYHELDRHRTAGIVLLVVGLAGMLAELKSTCGDDPFQPDRFTDLHCAVLVWNYIGWFVLSAGFLVVALSSSGVVRGLGGAAIVFCFGCLCFGIATPEPLRNGS